MKEKFRKLLVSFNNFFVFFLLVAFVITCCLTLFTRILMNTMGLVLTESDIGVAAKATFANVIVFSLLLSSIDLLRRKFTVERPVKRITDAVEKIIAGDFSVRIKKLRFDPQDKFNDIIDCLNKMAEELSSIETLRTDFLSNVSHELKTPLAVMQNYGTLLQSRSISEEKRIEYGRAINGASRRLAALVSNILRLTKLENQQIFPKKETYNLGEQLCECLIGFEQLIEKKEITVESDIAEEIFVSTDREMLSLVWNNLISNAVKFTERGGKISLSLTSERGCAIVKISDTGCGISPETGAHIFDKFYQGDTSHSGEGSGLGLSLVKRIVEITGSDISVESRLGEGSIFTVTVKEAAGDQNA